MAPIRSSRRKPGQSRCKPRNQGGIGKRQKERHRRIDVDRFKYRGGYKQDGRAYQHLQADHHHEVPTRGCAAHRQGGKGQRQGTQHAQYQAKHVDAARYPRAHDQSHAAKSHEQTDHAKRAQPLLEDQPIRQRHHQRHGRGDDGRNRSLDRLHRIEIQTQIQGILTKSRT